jgi:hypothetical protein
VRITRYARRLPFVATLAAFAAQSALAQDVQYQSVTKIDMGTGMNLMLKMAHAQEISETHLIKGRKMRTNSDKQSTIFDMDAGRFIMIDHDKKTYVSAPIGQMVAATAMMATSMNARSENGVYKATAQDSVGNKVDFTFNVSLDPTNERQSVNGQDAQRSFATIETDMKYTPEGESKSQDAGKIVLLLDNWIANSGPAYTAVHNFNQAMSKELREQAFSNTTGLNAIAATNPQMGEAMKKAAAEQAKLEGVAMRSTTHLVLVPVGLKFDRNLVVNPAQEGNGNNAAKRAFGGMVAGALGVPRRGERAAEAVASTSSTDKPKQTTVMKMTTEISNVQTTSLAASLFEPPAGYKEIPFTPPPPRK